MNARQVPSVKRLTLHAQTKVLGPFSPISNIQNACQTSGMAIPLTLNWRHLYKMRYVLEQRWLAVAVPLELSPHIKPMTEHRTFEPALTRLYGHGDSVYC